MDALLLELYQTKLWDAIVQYNREMDAHLLQTLAVADPFNNQTLIAREQGRRDGIYSLEKYTATLNEQAESGKNDDRNKKSDQANSQLY